MKNKLIALTVASIFALTACGGGSDDSGTNQPTTQPDQQSAPQSDQTPDTTPDTTPEEKPLTMKRQITRWKTEYLYGNVHEYGNDDPSYENSNGDGNNYKQLVIDGLTIDLPQADEKSMAIKNSNGRLRVVIAPTVGESGTAYARYGIAYVDKNSKIGGLPSPFDTAAEGSVVAFYQGQPTEIKNMPTTGAFRYEGHALGIDSANTLIDGHNIELGKSSFDVDFAKKELTGHLYDWQENDYAGAQNHEAVVINAKIQANTFQGTANETGYAEGKFYGDKAENLAGAFDDKTQNLKGVFGGNQIGKSLIFKPIHIAPKY